VFSKPKLGLCAPSEEKLMKDKTEQRIPLEPEKVEFLQAMAKSYQLPDIGKAVRCLIDYARENPDKQAEIFGEVHCQDC
jgi:hypothetical protein